MEVNLREKLRTKLAAVTEHRKQKANLRSWEIKI